MTHFWRPALLLGLLLVLGAGSYFYQQSPVGMLLYTPAAGSTPHYTPAFQIGCFVASVLQGGLALLMLLPERWWAITSPGGEVAKAAYLPPPNPTN